MIHALLIGMYMFSTPKLNRRFQFWTLTFLFIFLFSAIRFNFGPDYSEYTRIHEAIQLGNQSWGQSDILYKYLNLLVPDFQLLVIFMSAFYTLSMYRLVSSNSEKNTLWLSVFILIFNPYLFLVHQSSIRQTLAICVLVYAIEFIIKRDFVRYFALVVIATGFHISAIIMLPFYFIINQSRLPIKLLVIYSIGIFIFLATPIFDLILSFTLNFFPIHYQSYFNQGLQNSVRATILSSFYFFVIVLNFSKLKGKEIIYGKLSLIGITLTLLAYRVSMLTRVGMYFDLFMIVTIPQVISRIESSVYKRFTYILLFSIYILRYYSFFTNPNWSEFYSIYDTILGLRK